MNLLANKVVAVIGAGRGIGRGIAMMCTSEGACVVVNDYGGADDSGHDLGPAHDVVTEIEASGGSAVANTSSI